MANSNSGKHARKVTLDAAVSNAIEKAVDARKVAAFTVGAAGVLAGAAFAFGATPAMAADAGAAADTNTAPVTAGEKAGADAGKKDDGENADSKDDKAKKTDNKETEAEDEAAAEGESKAEGANKTEADASKKNGPSEKTDGEAKANENKTELAGDGAAKVETNAADVVDQQAKSGKAPAGSTTGEAEGSASADANKQGAVREDGGAAKRRGKRSLTDVQPTDDGATAQNREATSQPDPGPQANSTIELSKDKKDTLPNMYAWGSSDNVYIEKGQNQSVTFKFAAPTDGSTITKVAIFPSDGNTVDNTKSRRFLEYYSDAAAVNEHQPYSGTYEFKVDTDGTATLTMTKLYREGGLKNGESYSANRCIYVYGTDKNGSTVVLYKTNIARAATLIPPKTAGSIVLKYNEELTDKQIREKLQQALDAPTEAKGGKSVREQIKTASTAGGVGGRTGANGAFVQKPDDPEKKIVITDKQAYLPTELVKINKETSQKGQPTTYVTGVNNLKTYLISDLGYKSEALALTVARYDTRIDKPIVTDPNSISDEVKKDIAKKLANLNHIPQDKVTINADGTVTINFEGVDPSLAPTLKLKDLVLKQLKEEDVKVPTGDKAVFVANPLDYSEAEIKSIKKAIYDANKDNDKLGLTEAYYENQISLSYLTGNLTKSGTGNQGISNGQAENTITVKIKTDKAVAEFTSDVKANKLTKIPNIRTDYNVTWKSDKIDGRNSDEGLSWSEDKKTIIYRYDPTAAQEFDTNKILNLLTAKPKDDKSGLPTLTGGEVLAHEGDKDNPQKSHVGYVLKDGQPTTELSLGNMDGAYWKYSRPVDNSGEKLGDNLSNAGSYSWDEDAKPVKVAAKGDKVYKARLFVLPYGMTMYRNIYIESGKNPWNTAKAINVIFVPQTNHKTSNLKDSIDEHAVTNDDKKTPTDSKYYNASADKKKAYDDALSKAKTLYDSVKDTEESKLTEDQKADIDNATINLNKARAELDGDKTDKTKLEQDIKDQGNPKKDNTAASGTYETDKYKNVTEPSFLKDDGKPDTDKNTKAAAAKTAYDEALAEAEKVKADANATQKAVDDAKAKLDAARAKLNEFTTNKDELSAAIAKDGKVNTGKTESGTQDVTKADPTYQNSTKGEREAYDNAVAEAQKVIADPNASQKEVNDAIKKLKDAKDALDKNATNKAPLDAAVQKSFDNNDGKQSVFYKNAAAKKDTDPAAKKAVEDYDNALAEAKRVLGDKNATKADVDKAKEALEKAEAALHADTYQTKKTDLAQALADNFSGYLKPAYFNAFDKAQKDGADSQAAKDFKAYNDAYHAAKDLMTELNNPNSTITQDDVDKVKNKLVEARKIIDTYATDTSRLSAAALNDVAIQNSPAYKNVEELAGKQNPSEEEKTKVEAAKKAKEAYDKAVEKLHKALSNTLDKDKDAQGNPLAKIPDAKEDPTSKNYLDGVQAHANGEPLNKDVDSILQEMNDAAKALDKFKTNTDDLIKSINEDANTHPSPAFKNAAAPSYKKADGSNDTDRNREATAAANAYGQALAEAKAKLNDPNATQKDINDAKAALDNARKALDAYNTNITKLQESVAAHGTETVEGTKDSAAYRNASDPHFLKTDGKPDDDKNNQAKQAKADYDKALAEAQALIAKHNDANTPQDAKPMQAEIDAALAKLDAARKTLVGDIDDPKSGFGTDITDLEGEIHSSTPVGATDPIPGSVEGSITYKNALAKKGENGEENPDITRYKEALKKATELVEKQGSTKASERPLQKDVDDALQALKDAKKIINDGYKTDATALQDEAALGANDGNFTKSPEYKNAEAKKADGGGDNAELMAYKVALSDVQTMLNNFGKDGKPKKNADEQDLPTQAQVDAALKTLSDARKAVEAKYKTDATPLSNEVGDKDADGNPVVPPFEASVAYKNALEKKNAGNADATAKLEAYNEKLKAAQDLINKVNHPDPNAKPEDRPTQKQVDDALAALKQAKKDIEDNFKTKVDKLQNEVDDKDATGAAKDPTFENTTEFKNLKDKVDGANKPDDLVAYETALAKAKELIDKNDGKVTNADGQEVDVPKDQLPTQKEVNDALQKLKDIKEKITANYKTSSVNLQKEVDLSKNGDDDPRDDVFEKTPAFKNADAAKDGSDDNADMKAYQEALKKAKGMLEKFDRTTGKPRTDLKQGEKVPTQQELDKALKELQGAKKKIEDNYSTVKSDLRQEAGEDFTKSPEYQNAQAKGDDASKQALDEYKKALDEANSVLDDPNATQSEVDAALKKLKAAKDKLRDENSTDKSKLQSEADDDANFRKSVYFIIGNKDDIEAYNTALAEANSVLKDPTATQAQVDEALKKLKAAKYKLNHPFGAGSGSGIGSGYDTNAGDGFAVETSASQSASVDKTALQIEVNNAVDTNANTAEARAYRQALAEAKRVLADKDATQAQVDAALRSLKAAKAALLNSLRGASGASGLKLAKTGVETSMFASIAAAFAGFGVAGVASRRRKHSNE